MNRVVCGLCSHFQNPSIGLDKYLMTQEEMQCSHILKLCEKMRTYTHLSFASCSKFSPSRVFFCITLDENITVENCRSSQRAHADPRCEECILGQMAEYAATQFGG
jgi:hypothetical protein